MIESDWRNKLVKAFNQAYGINGYIWANDVRYRAGFPDLEVMLDMKVAHYELKLCKHPEYRDQMTQLQVAVCKRIAGAGVHVSCLTYLSEKNAVHIRNFNINGFTRDYIVPAQVFNNMWIDRSITCNI